MLKGDPGFSWGTNLKEPQRGKGKIKRKEFLKFAGTDFYPNVCRANNYRFLSLMLHAFNIGF